MRNSSNVISLIDRQQNCQECRLSSDCLVRVKESEDTPARIGIPVTGHVVRRGTHIFRMGDCFDTLYSVRSGAVKTYRLTEEGEQQVTGFYLPGDLFGLESVEADVYASNAVALDTSCICAIQFDRLETLCRSSREVARRLTGRMSQRIREGEEAFIVLGHKSADERMAWFLMNLSDKQQRIGVSADEINLPMPRTDIGSYLMLAVETVSRVLTRLQSAGLLEVERNRVRIKNFERLEQLAGCKPHHDARLATAAPDLRERARAH
jgi:CRP/FNR family transcriptional regulator